MDTPKVGARPVGRTPGGSGTNVRRGHEQNSHRSVAERRRNTRAGGDRLSSPPEPVARWQPSRRPAGRSIGLAEDPDALDPTLARTFVGRMVFLHMCEKLYDLNARLQIVPQLAAAMPSSGDKKTMTIRIRRGVRFNDGTPLNAAAVKTSLDRHRTLAGSARASEISPITAVQVANNYTVRLRPCRALLAADGPAGGPCGDDHVAEGARSARRGSRRARYASGRSSSRAARRATGSCSTSRSSTTRGAGSS